MTSSHPVERREVVVVGEGQSGLAASNLLRQRGVDQLVLERGVVANMWDTMPWRAFRLVTQNWQCRLPGQDEPPGGPDSFMDAPDIRDHLRAYAARLAGEVRCGVEVKLVEPLQEGGYGIETSAGPLEAEAVIVATGAFHAPRIPDLAAGLDRGLRQLHSSEYRAAEELPLRRCWSATPLAQAAATDNWPRYLPPRIQSHPQPDRHARWRGRSTVPPPDPAPDPRQPASTHHRRVSWVW